MNQDLYRTDLPLAADKILCVIPCGMSITISTTPTLEALRQTFPSAQITCIVESTLIPLLDIDIIDRFWPHIQGTTTGIPWQQTSTFIKLQIENFDLFIDFFTPHPSIEGDLSHPLFTTSLIRTHLLYRACAHATTSIGFTVDSSHYEHLFFAWLNQKRRLSINIPTPKPNQLNQQCLADLMLKLIIDEKKVVIAAPLFPKKIKEINVSQLNQAWQKLNENALSFCLHIGGSHQSLRWPIENSIEFIKKACLHFNARIHLVGIIENNDDLEELTEALYEELSTGRVMNHIGFTDISTLAFIIKKSNLMITTFGGPLHIADAYNIPLITLGSASVNTAHYSARESRQILLQTLTLCSPCLKPKCDQTVSCMKQITANKVLEAVNAMISDRFSRVQS